MGLKREKRWSRVLSCLGAWSSATDDSDEPARSRRSQRSSSWSSKKTVPVDAAIENALLVAADEHEKLPPAKKGFFKIFHKSKGKKQQPVPNPRRPATDSTQAPAHHVISKCEPEAQTANQFEVSGSVQTGTKTNHKSSAKPSTAPSLSTICRAQNKNINKKKRNGESSMGSGVIVLAVTLAMLLLGGRMIAIFCMSAFFYILPYFCTRTIHSLRKKSHVSEIETGSEQYKKKKKVAIGGLVEINGTSSLFR